MGAVFYRVKEHGSQTAFKVVFAKLYFVFAYDWTEKKGEVEKSFA